MNLAFIAVLAGLHTVAFAAEPFRSGPPQTLRAELKSDRVAVTVAGKLFTEYLFTADKAAPWMDAHGIRDGETEGLAIFCDPKNRWHPAPWFTRDYGFFSPTPLWWLEKGFVEFAPGENLHLRYRVLIHAGAPSKDQLVVEYQQWVVR